MFNEQFVRGVVEQLYSSLKKRSGRRILCQGKVVLLPLSVFDHLNFGERFFSCANLFQLLCNPRGQSRLSKVVVKECALFQSYLLGVDVVFLA